MLAGLATFQILDGKIWAVNRNQKHVALFPEQELFDMLYKHYNSVFNTVLDTTVSLDRYYFAESFDITVNKEKNTVFDCAEEIIQKLGNDFDASSLRDGIIPEGMSVGQGSVATKKYLRLPIDGLKNYDAVIAYKNYLSIATKAPMSQWSGLKKIHENSAVKIRSSENQVRTYEGHFKGEEYRFWKFDCFEKKISVEQLTPSLKIKEEQSAVNVSQLKELLSPLVIETLKI